MIVKNSVYDIRFMYCAYCRMQTKKKYFYTLIPYCSQCNRDIFGTKVYECSICGLAIPENNMYDTVTCFHCWHKCA